MNPRAVHNNVEGYEDVQVYHFASHCNNQLSTSFTTVSAKCPYLLKSSGTTCI